MGKVSARQFDANALAAMYAFHTRTGAEAVESNTPFLELLRGERRDPAVVARLAGLLAEYRALCAAAERSGAKVDVAAVSRFFDAHGDDLMLAQAAAEKDEADFVGGLDLAQRMEGVKIFFRYLTAKGWHPAAMLRQVIAVGRALHVSPWSEMSMEEIGDLMSETKAAHSHRCKLLSGEIKRSGQSGARLPGQKTAAAGKTYKKIRKGNTSRKGGKKFIRKPIPKNI
jgi:hypothetical protein